MLTLKSSLVDLKEHLDEIVQTHTQEHLSIVELENHLYNDIEIIISKFKESSEIAIHNINNNENEEDFELSYKTTTSLAEKIKSFCILIRDELLEIQISRIKNIENPFDIEKWKIFLKELKSVIKEVAQNIIDFLNDILNNNSTKNLKQLQKHTQIVQNPIEVYWKQLDILLEQSQSLKEQEKELFNIQKIIAQVKKLLGDNLSKNTETLSLLTNNIQSVEEQLNVEEDLVKAVQDALKKNDDFFRLNQSETIDEPTLEDLFNQLPKSKTYTVGHNGGYLSQKNIDFNNKIDSWLEILVLPLYNEISEQLSHLLSQGKFTLSNIKNKLSLISDSNIEESKSDIKKVLNDLLNNQNNALNNLKDKKEKIEEKMSQFYVSEIFNNKDFLSLNIQSSMNQLLRRNQTIYTASQNRFKKIKEFFSSIWSKLTIRNQITNREKTANFIYERRWTKETEIYDQVFQKHLFLGDVFTISRLEEENRLKEAIALWQEGFHVAILVKGNPLSGKTTFANKISNQFFPKNTVKLEPNTVVRCFGRKFKTENNLKESLEQLSKNVSGAKPLIWIDDLELWHSPETDFLEHIRYLKDFISKKSKEMLFLVTINPVLLRKLDAFLQFSDEFLTRIDVSLCGFDEIKDAINIRHAATQKILVNKEEQELTSNRKDVILSEVFEDSNGNIGEALQNWTHHSRKIIDNKVIFDYKKLSFNFNINDKNGLLLEQFFIYKKLSDQALISSLGQENFEAYRPIIRNLINEKIIIRDYQTNLLSINPIVINEVLFQYHKMMSSHVY